MTKHNKRRKSVNEVCDKKKKYGKREKQTNVYILMIIKRYKKTIRQILKLHRGVEITFRFTDLDFLSSWLWLLFQFKTLIFFSYLPMSVTYTHT